MTLHPSIGNPTNCKPNIKHKKIHKIQKKILEEKKDFNDGYQSVDRRIFSNGKGNR